MEENHFVAKRSNLARYQKGRSKIGRVGGKKKYHET
jgi:hypothetical protein